MIESQSIDFDAVLTRLQAAATAVPWAERREIVRHVATALAERDCGEATIGLVYALAADPKWEVRADVADLLIWLPDEHFARVAARLADDSNSFVRKATERALDRRRRGQRTARRARQGMDQVQSQYAALERLHGKLAAERSREIAERLFDNLVGATVHEMRGILTPLKATAVSLMRHLDDGVIDAIEFRRQLGRFGGRLAFMERLLDDMRTYSMAPPLERRSERLSDLVAEAVRMAKEHLEANSRNHDNVQVNVDVPTSITLEVARHQILVAIANVIKNAIDAFPDAHPTFRAATVQIRGRLVDDETLELVVADTGMGICAEDLADIRDFVPGRTTKKNHGTGFGIPIAHRNVKAHGGSLGIESREEVGTTVTIVLPTSRKEDEDEDAQGFGG